MKARAQRRPAHAAATTERTRRTGLRQPSLPSARWRSLRRAAAQNAHIANQSITDEQHAGDSNDRPRDKNGPHRQFRYLGQLVPAEARELNAPPDKHQRKNQHESMGY